MLGKVPMIELQRMIMPDLDVCREPRLYVRCMRNAVYSYANRQVRARAGGRVSFATLYGAFNIEKWRRLAGVSRLFLRLDLTGSGEITVWNLRKGYEPRLLAAQEVADAHGEMMEMPLTDAPDGLIAAEFTAWGGAVLTGGAWLTPDRPVREVRLGVVITSFHRESAVRAAVRRLLDGLERDAVAPLRVLVVDNGRTLTAEDVAGARLIPNLNLGGAGGFARGLAELQDDGGYTHAVFMDDDASAELESLRRAVQLLRYVRDDHTAIVSGLLFEEYPGIQLEAAGQMPGDTWIPVRPGVDLRITRNVVENEVTFAMDYGGWWMFFFPLSHVTNLPFPFFVRGDDVEFPRANPFSLVTLNGINSFGPDFFRKESPVNVALDRRGNLVNVLLHGSLRSALTGSIRGLQKGLIFANRYCYDHVDALSEGTRDVLAGPTRFEDLAGFADGRRKEYAACARQPRLEAADVPAYPKIVPRRHGVLWHAVRLLAFNGHLVPRWLLIRSPGILGTVWESPGSAVFLRPRVLIYEGLNGRAVLAERDVRRYFGSLARLAWLSLRLIWAVPRLRREFRSTRKRFGSRAYWNAQFEKIDQEKPAAD